MRNDAKVERMFYAYRHFRYFKVQAERRTRAKRKREKEERVAAAAVEDPSDEEGKEDEESGEEGSNSDGEETEVAPTPPPPARKKQKPAKAKAEPKGKAKGEAGTSSAAADDSEDEDASVEADPFAQLRAEHVAELRKRDDEYDEVVEKFNKQLERIIAFKKRVKELEKAVPSAPASAQTDARVATLVGAVAFMCKGKGTSAWDKFVAKVNGTDADLAASLDEY
jgi:hypothetical protein